MDITKCENTNCSLKNDCIRFTAIPSLRQAYADFKQDENKKCDYYLISD